MEVGGVLLSMRIVSGLYGNWMGPVEKGKYFRKQVQQTPSQTINPELMSEFLIQERLTRAGVLHLTL